SSWELLTVTDFEVILLRLRQEIFADLIRTDVWCSMQGCRTRIEVSFRIGEYLAYYKPRSRRDVGEADASGWLQFASMPVQFRLPTVADQIAVTGTSRPKRELIERCIRPPDLSSAQLRKVETAMSALAPSLSNDLQGRCAQCGSTVDLYFDVQQFVLQELRD